MAGSPQALMDLPPAEPLELCKRRSGQVSRVREQEWRRTQASTQLEYRISNRLALVDIVWGPTRSDSQHQPGFLLVSFCRFWEQMACMFDVEYSTDALTQNIFVSITQGIHRIFKLHTDWTEVPHEQGLFPILAHTRH